MLLSKLDEELQRVKESVEERKSNLNEVHLTLSAPTIHPVVVSNKKGLLSFDLPDWRVLLAIGVVVIIVMGIFFFVVIVVKPWLS